MQKSLLTPTITDCCVNDNVRRLLEDSNVRENAIKAVGFVFALNSVSSRKISSSDDGADLVLNLWWDRSSRPIY